MSTAAIAAQPPCTGQRDPECDLLIRIAGGDRAAFEIIYERYSRKVYSLAVRMLGDSQIAQDVTQEVFLGIWRGAREFTPQRGSPRSWILALAHHKSVDAVRRARRHAAAEPLSPTLPADFDVAEEAALLAEGARVRRALGDLSGAQRQAIALAYYGGYTQGEISRLLGVPLGTVKTRTRDGMLRLRALLTSN